MTPPTDATVADPQACVSQGYDTALAQVLKRQIGDMSLAFERERQTLMQIAQEALARAHRAEVALSKAQWPGS